jgi:tagaturonate reductase
MPSIKQFRDKKVRILNGSHTGMVPIGLQIGCETVMDAFNNADLEKFINTMVAEEVIPMIEEDQAEVQAFASGILERFYNPHIRHLLKSISLNSLSKWEARNYPTVKDNWFKAGKVAERELFTFAALLTLYSGEVDFEPNDTPEHVEFIQKVWNNDDIHGTVKAIVENRNIWTVDLSEVMPLTERVAEYVKDILENGMSAALKKML